MTDGWVDPIAKVAKVRKISKCKRHATDPPWLEFQLPHIARLARS